MQRLFGPFKPAQAGLELRTVGEPPCTFSYLACASTQTEFAAVGNFASELTVARRRRHEAIAGGRAGNQDHHAATF